MKYFHLKEITRLNKEKYLEKIQIIMNLIMN